MAKKEGFAGASKVGRSILHKFETKLMDWFIPYIPSWIETYHLTYLTVLWSLLILGFCYLAKNNMNWMWLTSLMIVFQFITDYYDGKIGKYRNTGLVKWGYYMDHFLDYIFLCSILIGYAFIIPNKFNAFFFILAILGAYMVNSFLLFAVTNQFKIAYLGIGPTEIRLVFIAINTMLIFTGKTYPKGALVYILLFCLVGLIVVVARTQKAIWRMDMRLKSKQKKKKR